MKSKISLFATLALLSGAAFAQYSVGDSVECNWKNGGRYYAGQVASAEGGKLFIHYDDGDKEHTTAGMCRPMTAVVASGRLRLGSPVECLWKNGSTWYSGVIAEKTGKQVFIHYNDGDKEHTTVDKCRARGAAPSGAMVKGSAVSCKWKGGAWYPGVIAEKTGDAVFIHYNDGDKEHTKLSMCRPR